MANTIEENAQDVFNMLAKGQFIEAMEKYFDDDVRLFEGNRVKTVRKIASILKKRSFRMWESLFNIRYQILL